MRGFLLNIVKTFSFDKKQFKRVIALQGPKIVKKYLTRKYLNQSNFINPKLNQKWLEYLEKLNENGFVVIENEFEEIYKEIVENLDFESLENSSNDEIVLDYCFDLGFTFPGILKLLSDRNLCSLFCNFYNRQAIYRNHPQILSHSKTLNTKKRSSEIAHIDGYKQLTCFYMLSDMNKNTSQLYIYPKSHKLKSYNYNRAPSIEENIQEKEIGLTAKKGDLVIFNSGALWHKGFSRENKRIILNFILTSGWLPTPEKENYDADYLKIKLQNKESFIKNCFSGFC